MKKTDKTQHPRGLATSRGVVHDRQPLFGAQYADTRVGNCLENLAGGHAGEVVRNDQLEILVARGKRRANGCRQQRRPVRRGHYN